VTPGPSHPDDGQHDARRPGQHDLAEDEVGQPVPARGGDGRGVELPRRPMVERLPHQVGRPHDQGRQGARSRPAVEQVAPGPGRHDQAQDQPAGQERTGPRRLQGGPERRARAQPPARVRAPEHGHHRPQRQPPAQQPQRAGIEARPRGHEHRHRRRGERRHQDRPGAATSHDRGDGGHHHDQAGVGRPRHDPQRPQVVAGQRRDPPDQERRQRRLVDIAERGVAPGRQQVELVLVEPETPAEHDVHGPDAGSQPKHGRPGSSPRGRRRLGGQRHASSLPYAE
jgi:hypothetical protein